MGSLTQVRVRPSSSLLFYGPGSLPRFFLDATLVAGLKKKVEATVWAQGKGGFEAPGEAGQMYFEQGGEWKCVRGVGCLFCIWAVFVLRKEMPWWEGHET